MEKARLLALNFSKSFQVPSSLGAVGKVFSQRRLISTDSALVFTEEDVYNLLCKHPAKTNSTPDCIPSIFYKKFALFLCEPLKIIFDRVYSNSTVPRVFKRTIGTPVYKKGKRTGPENYRPIAQDP